MEVATVNNQPPANIPGNDDGPLVAVSFKKNPHQVEKYLEAEPKALGLTQITLSVFQISMLLAISIPIVSEMLFVEVTRIIGAGFVIIAGSVAVAAQNLHLPTLKACFAMQVLAAVASVINVILSASTLGENYRCWRFSGNSTEINLCKKAMTLTEHFDAEVLLINVAALAISVTLAAYSCKTINCCAPRSSMPVITISAPPAQQ